MTWVKVDDSLDTDRRIEDLSLAATGLLMRAASYSARYLLDGRVDGKWVRRRAPNKVQRRRLIAELVDAGLVSPTEDPDGFRILPLHDDSDPLVNAFTRAEVEEHREYDAEKKRKRRQRQRAQAGMEAASIPEGRPGDSLVRPRSGRPGGGAGRDNGAYRWRAPTPEDEQ